LEKDGSVNPLHYVRATAIALSCSVFNGGSAPITYPNQAYIFSGGTFSPVPGAFNVKAVAAEGDTVLAVRRDGRVVPPGLSPSVLEHCTNAVAVGLNYTMGAVLTADGRVLEFGRPALQPPGLTNVIAIDVSGQYNDDDLDYKLAVTSDGRVVTWGYFVYPPSAEVPGVVTAAGGWLHIVALKNDGTVVEWNFEQEPETVPGLSNVVAVAAGGTHSVALKADGTVVAWGANHSAQLDVPPGLSNVVAISASEYHTLALKSDGTLAAWGQMYFGDDVTPPANLSNVLAIATSGTRNVVICALPMPPPIPYPNQACIFSGGTFSPVPGFTNIKAFAVEDDRVLGVTPDGHVLASGLPEHWLPQSIREQLTNVVAVGLSAVQAAALTADGRVIDLEDEPRWPQPPGLTNVIAFDVAGQAGDDDLDYKLAVTSDGRVVTWGHFGFPPSAEVPGVVTAAGGWSHIVALKGDGTVVQWDLDHEPEVVAGLNDVVAVAAGGEHSVALKADGTVTVWGEKFFGQLDVPPDLSNVVAIAASEHQTLALKSDGTLVAWGQGYNGEDVTPPAGLSNAVAIASSGRRNLALVSILPQRPTLGIAATAPALGQLTISLSGEGNSVYAIEASPDLLTWHFFRNVTNETGSLSFEVGNTNANGQFFRAKRL
jgi:alpha-tubulin suppressor-like RCC1 family protein